MRVHHLISSSGLYGAEKMVVNLSRAQQEQGDSVRIVVFDNAHSPNTEIADHARDHGVEVELLKCGGRFDPRTVRHLRKILKTNAPDVLHVHGYKANLYGYFATRLTSVTLVGTCHRFDTEPQNRFDGPLQRRFDAVAAVSDEAAASLRDVYNLPETLVTSIPNGIDWDALQGERPTAPSPTVGLVGRLAPEKAPLDFLTVAKAVSATNPRTRFIVVGDGPLRSQLEQATQDMGVSPVVDFLGFQEDMTTIYSQLTILVQPSLREGMPMTTLEAMASGVAVIATRAGALPDVIEDAVTGYLVDIHDTDAMAARVRDLLDHPSRLVELTKAAQQRAKTSFSSAAMATNYRKFYERAMT